MDWADDKAAAVEKDWMGWAATDDPKQLAAVIAQALRAEREACAQVAEEFAVDQDVGISIAIRERDKI
jgi:hypothetical protein